MYTLINVKIPAIVFLLSMSSFLVNAHEVWLEKDATGPARVYLGEPGEPEVGNEIDKLSGSQVFIEDRQTTAHLSQKNDHWQANITGEGDIRLYSDSVWQPWSIEDKPWWKFWASSEEKLQGAILQARAGRSDTQAKLSFELVPVSENANVFTATFKGAPLQNQAVSILTPSKKQTELITDDKGQVAVTTDEQGRYILTSVHSEDTQAMHSGKSVTSLMYISTLSFVAP